MSTDDKRQAELNKYKWAYSKQPNYRCKKARLEDSSLYLTSVPCRGSYLDVSCGRGEMLDLATTLGFSPVQGTEIVPQLVDNNRVIRAWAHSLPFSDSSFDVVSFLDVMEHLLPGDDELACRELNRVASKFVLITVSNLPSHNSRGDDLHINKRPYSEWERLFRSWFEPARVVWVKGGRRSEYFRIEKI